MKIKVDKKTTRMIIKSLDAMARKYGLGPFKHGTSKWLTTQRSKARLSKQLAALRREQAEIRRKLNQ